MYKPQNTELQKFLPPFLYFWKYNPSPNGQIISLAGAQVHLQIQLLRDECYKLLKIFFFFFAEQYENSCKGTENRGALSRVPTWNFNHL